MSKEDTCFGFLAGFQMTVRQLNEGCFKPMRE